MESLGTRPCITPRSKSSVRTGPTVTLPLLTNHWGGLGVTNGSRFNCMGLSLLGLAPRKFRLSELFQAHPAGAKIPVDRTRRRSRLRYVQQFLTFTTILTPGPDPALQ